MQKQIYEMQLIIDKKDMEISNRDAEIERQFNQLTIYRDIEQQRDQLQK